MAVVILIVSYSQFKPATEVSFGISYSYQYAQSLGFDPKTVYLDMLADLKPKKIRLMAYWEDLEPTQGKFEFNFIDQLLLEAQKEGIEVVLALGKKQPRWPECHVPEWYNHLNQAEKDQAVLTMLKESVSHFKQWDSVTVWQIENEPFFVFGIDCPGISEAMINEEIKTVREIDDRPVMITDSGELGSWQKVFSSDADILGATMYRLAFNSKYGGYFKYPLPPAFYRLKAGMFRLLGFKKPIVGSELQAEPWLIQGVYNTDIKEQTAMMNRKVFESNIKYAKKVGFEDNYLWGVEWWYWLARDKGDWGIWEAAKSLMNSQK